MSSLHMLQNLYGSSESDNEEDNLSKNTEKLPLPKKIKAMMKDPGEIYDDPNKHQGRSRTFQHEQGNWATYVCLPYEDIFLSEFRKCVENAFDTVKVVKWFTVDHFHISLSRTVAIPHHFIDPIVHALQEQFRNISCFSVEFAAADLRFYVNDDCTRSFCGIEITESDMKLSIQRIVDKVNDVFARYRCESFYEEASYHISLAWCLGDILKDKSCREILDSLRQSWLLLETNNEHLFSFRVSNILLKCGNKSYIFNLT